MTIWVVGIAIGALLALSCGALVLAWRRGRLGLAAVLLLPVGLAIWALDLAALATGYHDANSFATCDPDCSGVHYAAAVAFLAAPLIIALSAAGMLVSVGGRIRMRRANAGEAVG